MDREKTLIKNTVLYMVANFATKILGFLLVPFYTYYLTPGEYGYFDLINTTVLVLVPIITLQINEGLYRFLLDGGEQKDIDKVLTNAVALMGKNIFAALVLGIIFVQFNSTVYGYLIICQIISTIVSGMWQQIARGLKKNTVFSVSGVIYTFIMLVFNVVFVVFLGMKIEALIISGILASAGTILYIELRLNIFKRLSLKLYEKAMQKALIKYCLPLLPNSINWWIMGFSSRYIINYYMGVDANGIFGVANKFAALLMLINSIFNLAWQESAISEYNSKDRDEFYTKMFNIYMKVLLTSMIVLLPLSKLAVMLFIDKRFGDAWLYLPLLYMSAVFTAFSSFFGVGYLSAKETRGVFTSSIVGAVTNILINMFLIPVMHLQAAAFAIMLAFLFVWIIRIFHTRKYFTIRIQMHTFWVLMLIAASFCYFYYYSGVIALCCMLVVSVAFFILFNKEIIIGGTDFIRTKLGFNRVLQEKPEAL